MKPIACLLFLAVALGDFTAPKLETGGWRPILGRTVSDSETSGRRPRESSFKRSGIRNDVPAFYVWLPTELLDHIDRGRVAPARHRPNYLPNQNLVDFVGETPSSQGHPPFQNAFPPHAKGPPLGHPREDLRQPVGYGGPVRRPDLGNRPELPSPDLVSKSRPVKNEFTVQQQSGYGVPNAGVDHVLPEHRHPQAVGDQTTTYDFEEPSKTIEPGEPRTSDTPRRPKGYGTPSFYPPSEPQTSVQDGPVAPKDYSDERPGTHRDSEEGGQMGPRRHSEDSCSPVISAAAAVANLGNRSLRQVAESVGAGAFFDRVDLGEDALLSIAGAPFTLFLPSDESLELTSPQLLDSWRSDKEALRKALQNHILPNQVTLEQLIAGTSYATVAGPNALLAVHSHPNGVVTVNGQRLVRADVSGPHGSIVHVLSGPLTPTADRNIATTVTDCGKYEGFLTLASGTGVIDLLKESQTTLFLPSNDALSKVPPEELKVYHGNATALKEFLMYHIAEGVHYSHDLRDGQYLRSMHNGLPIRVSINVDGCNRRLYEANNSPLYQADIPASNGVIHVIDWVLLPGDHKWCRDVILP